MTVEFVPVKPYSPKLPQELTLGNVLFEGDQRTSAASAAGMFLADLASARPDIRMLVIDATGEIAEHIEHSVGLRFPDRVCSVDVRNPSSPFSIDLMHRGPNESIRERAKAIVAMLDYEVGIDIQSDLHSALTVAILAGLPIEKCFEIFTMPNDAFETMIDGYEARDDAYKSVRYSLEEIRVLRMSIHGREALGDWVEHDDAEEDDPEIVREQNVESQKRIRDVRRALDPLLGTLSPYVNDARFDLDEHFDHGGILTFNFANTLQLNGPTVYALVEIARRYCYEHSNFWEDRAKRRPFITVVHDPIGASLPSIVELRFDEERVGNSYVYVSGLLGTGRSDTSPETLRSILRNGVRTTFSFRPSMYERAKHMAHRALAAPVPARSIATIHKEVATRLLQMPKSIALVTGTSFRGSPFFVNFGP